jgi:hypothetical protein
MAGVWLGDIGFAESVRPKKIALTGLPELGATIPVVASVQPLRLGTQAASPHGGGALPAPGRCTPLILARPNR